MRALIRTSPAAVALVVSIATSAHATTLVRMNLAQLVRASREIVRAKCVANTTGWDAGEIWTFVTFEVQESWRGSASGEIKVRVLGGRTAQFTSWISGAPRFQPGEEVVLFLEPTDRGDYSVVSWQQGTFRIHRPVGSGEGIITQDTAAFETFDPATHRFSANGVRRMGITEFRSKVEASIKNDEGKTR